MALTLVTAHDLKLLGGNVGPAAVAARLAARLNAGLSAINALGSAMAYKGAIACAGNPNYPAAASGDVYIVSTAGLIGGGAGIAVDVGDMIICQVAGIAGTQAAVGANWDRIEHNLVGAMLSANNLSDLASAATARGNLGLGTAAVLASDVDGTLAANSDVKFATQKAVKTYADTKQASGASAGGDLAGSYPNPTIGVGKLIHSAKRVQAIVELADADATLSAAQLCNSQLFAITPTLGRSLTTDNASNIINALSGQQVGTWVDVSIVSEGAAAVSITVAAGAGVTLRGATTIVNVGTRAGSWRIVVTGAATVTMIRLA